MSYLTEKKLVEIIKEIYPSDMVHEQYKYGRRKVDAAVIIPADRVQELAPKCVSGCFYDYFENCDEEFTEDDLNEPATLLFEFDGPRHYTKARAVDDGIGCKWEEIDSLVYQIRIPYWIQPTVEISQILFGISKDWSGGFPHGFISKSIILPGSYTSGGEFRFLMELENLPKVIASDVVQSLINRKENPRDVCSGPIWFSLVRNYTDGDLKKFYEACVIGDEDTATALFMSLKGNKLAYTDMNSIMYFIHQLGNAHKGDN